MMLCDTGEMRKLINPRFLTRNLGFILYATDARACLSDAYSYALIITDAKFGNRIGDLFR